MPPQRLAPIANPSVTEPSPASFIASTDGAANLPPSKIAMAQVAQVAAESQAASDIPNPTVPAAGSAAPPGGQGSAATNSKTPEEIPVGDPSLRDRVQITVENDRMSLTARDAPLGAVVNLIAQQHGLNIIAAQDMSQRLTVTLNNVALTDALDALLAMNGYTWVVQRNMLVITPLDGTRKAAPMVQNRLVQVFSLNYVAALDVDKVVKGLLSPVGQSFIVQTMPTDQRRTHEQVVVEDLPYYLQRISDYIRAIDCQPRQVLVEAHVLQVTLRDDCKHGVNFEEILRVAGANVSLQTQGFGSAAASPASLLRVEGTYLNSVIEALKTTTDAKTLASPKVAVLNGQEARIQVGGQIGYLTTTATETSAVQTVNFLDTGVILRVVPVITDTRQVLLDVKPQVSTGSINPTTGLPDTQTTEVTTKVMLADGEAIVIGGLIKELDTEVENKIPWLGDVKYIGRIFQRRTVTRERSEVIIALLPRIISDVPCQREFCPQQVERSRTPLFAGPLVRVDRTPWEPLLKSATYPVRTPPEPVKDFCAPDCPQIGQPLPYFPQMLSPPLPPPAEGALPPGGSMNSVVPVQTSPPLLESPSPPSLSFQRLPSTTP